jgi:transcriptional regulator with XRE-family HTH domain
MRSKYLQQVLDETPEDVKIFAKLYGNLILRIHEILEQKGMSQNGLAERLGKKPSEISKWLSGEHNLTLRTIAKLEAELGEPLLSVAQNDKFSTVTNKDINMAVMS